MTPDELRKAIAALISKAAAIEAGAKAAERELTDAEVEKINGFMDESDTLGEDLKKAEATEESREKATARVAAGTEWSAQSRGRKVAAVDPVEPATVREKWRDDPACGFKTPRQYMMKVMQIGMRPDLPIDARMKFLKIAAALGTDEQQVAANPFGGFLVPEAFVPSLLKVQFEGDPTAGRTQMVPMTSPIVRIPARVDKDHSKSVTGGFQFFRRAETDTSDATRQEFEQISLNAHSMTGIVFATEELLRDSPISFAAIIADGFREEFGAFILDEKINGTGVGQYEGFLNTPSVINVAKEDGQAKETIVLENILNVRARLWGYDQAIWLANQTIIPQLGVLSLTVGTGGGPIFLFSAQEDVADTLLGRPIFFSEFMPTLGTQGDLMALNMSQYLEGQMQGMESAESIHVRFVNNERAFRMTARNDGRAWWRTALTPKNGDTLSPFVNIATRA